MPGGSHLIFIPAVLLFGVVLGFIWGTRAAADRINLERRRDEERAKAREERAARQKAREEAAREAGGESEADADANVIE